MKKTGVLLLVIVILLLVNIALIINKIPRRYSSMDNSKESISGGLQGMDKYAYFCSDGGPFILMPSTLKNKWKGAGGLFDAASPKSDYGQACKIITSGSDGCVNGIINAYDNQIFVVDSPMLAMPKDLNDTTLSIYAIVSWEDINLDGLIDRAKDSIKANDFVTSEESIQFDVDRLVFMYAGDVYGNCIYGFRDIALRAGTYHISEAHWKNNESEVRIFNFSLRAGPASRQE